MHHEYAARGEKPAVKLTWYDGDKIPASIHGHPTGGGGNLFVGEKGMLWADYDRYHLYPEEKFAGYKPPPQTIPRSIGHHAEWIKACKTGSPTTCNFSYSGPLSEAVLLGNVAYRTGQNRNGTRRNFKPRIARKRNASCVTNTARAIRFRNA